MAAPRLTRISTAELRRELDRRASQLGQVESRRRQLESELAHIDAEIAALGGTAASIPSSGARPRGRVARRGVGRSKAARTRSMNKTTLTAALQDALKGKVLSVGDAAEAVLRSGYKTNAANFRTMVNLTLLKRKDLFKKQGRGRYTVR
ncbi:MAG: hypothetical protein IT430_20380 [Phycisphaerales bacterium]|nr:hypothetical protein [Phycisphaerales bacterium]